MERRAGEAGDLGRDENGARQERVQDLTDLPLLPIDFPGDPVLDQQRRAEAVVCAILENPELLISYVLGVGRNAKAGDDDDGNGKLKRAGILGVFGHVKYPVSASIQKKWTLAFYLKTYRSAWTPLTVQGKSSFILNNSGNLLTKFFVPATIHPID